MGTRTATFSREIAVVGAGMCPFGAFSDKTSPDLLVEAYQEMEKSVDKGFDPEVIDAIYVGNFSSDIFEGQGHLTPIVTDWVGLVPRPATRVEDACASSGMALRQGLMAVASGLCDVILVGGVEPGDIELAETHDCFTIAEIIGIEDVGLFPPGEGYRAVEDGLTRRDGPKPVNTSGGLKAKGHPVGASGAGQGVEVWEQMRGEAGERQVPGGIRLALTHNVGATGSTCVVHVFERT